MALFCLGSNRFVLLLGPFAIKFARTSLGRKASRNERAVWQSYRGIPGNGDLLCPVLACDPIGVIMIMRRAERTLWPYLSTWPERQPKWHYDRAQINLPRPGNPKPQDWGVINGAFVMVNYGNVR